MSTLTLAQAFEQQYLDNTGVPLAGGWVQFNVAGLSTPQNTYADAQGVTLNSNPVLLNSAGRPTSGGIFWLPAAYDVFIYNSVGVLVDSKLGVLSTGVTVSLVGTMPYYFDGDPNAPISATSYASGTTFDTCQAGTRILTLDSANAVGTYALEGMLLSVSGITTTASLVNLSDGTPDTPLVSITTTSSTGAPVRSGLITFAMPGAPKQYAIKTIVSGGLGFNWGNALVRIS